MMRSAGGDLEINGWMRLPFRFSETELATLSAFGPHVGRGVRLSDMSSLAAALPKKFRTQIRGLGFNPLPNRAVGFVKSKADNWSLPWHQDRVIAMDAKVDDPNYINWNRKSGVWHCEPAEDILRQIAFAYIAFDSFQRGEGGLELAAGTHHFGKMAHADIKTKITASNIVTPNMQTGDVILVSALTLHRSILWSGAGQRRALRLDFLRAALA